MESANRYASDVAFSPSVKAVQERKGSRGSYARMEQEGSWETRITPDLARFIAEQTSVYLATVNAAGQPYIQHRGGPAGFLRVIDDQTLGWVDYVGNRQFITTGNLADNPKAHLFLMDYANRRRIKIWGTAAVADDDANLFTALMPSGYRARAEQVILFRIVAWDANCPQHIPVRMEAADYEAALRQRDARIRELEAKLKP